MGLLSRLSDGFWSYVSPSKTDATETAAPKMLPRAKRHGPIPARRERTKGINRATLPMSAEERVKDWQRRSLTVDSAGVKRKRVAPLTPSSGIGRLPKARKMDDVDMVDTLEFEDEDSEALMGGALYEDMELDASDADFDEDMVDDISFVRDRSTERLAYDAIKSPAVDESAVLSDDEYNDGTPIKRQIVSADQVKLDLGISSEELRDQGWDDDHITLMERLTLRGFEPVLPAYWKFNYPWLPEGLFCKDDDSFIRSVKDEMAHSHRAFDDLLEMSSRIRDGIFYNTGKPIEKQVVRSLPERQGKRFIEKFINWCDKDSGLDLKRAIPMLTIVARPKEVQAETMQRIARNRLGSYAEQWKEAFRIRQSIEGSPVSRASTVLTYPIPTLYAVIASYNLVAVVAYRADDGPDADIRSVLLMDNNNINYDFWNALAIALLVCHVRNVRVRIAEETGIGLKVPGVEDSEVDDDPDL
jgi:hypothetical protein